MKTCLANTKIDMFSISVVTNAIEIFKFLFGKNMFFLLIKESSPYLKKKVYFAVCAPAKPI